MTGRRFNFSTLPLSASAVCFIFLGLTTAPAFSAGENLQAKMTGAYKRADFATAEKVGEKIIARNKNDYQARYFLANIYVLEKRNDDAIDQYRLCFHNSRNEAIRAYSGIALERLLKLKEKYLADSLTAETTNRKREIKAFEQKVNSETRQEQVRLQKEWDQALANLNGRQSSSWSRNPYNGGFGGGRYRPEMDSTYREREQINQNYRRRMADLLSYKEALLSQANCGTGKIRIAPGLSNGRVKNYVNYGDQSEAADIPVDNPLRAEARSLDSVTPGKAGAQKPSKASPKAAPKPAFRQSKKGH